MEAIMDEDKVAGSVEVEALKAYIAELEKKLEQANAYISKLEGYMMCPRDLHDRS
jgi:hypothetical protein